MATATVSIALPMLRPYPQRAVDPWRPLALRRLTAVWRAASTVLFDDASRIVFFSDCHRGDNSRADAFARNEPLFLGALEYYYDQGYTYVEVGDGDELWQNPRIDDIRRAHPSTFDLLDRFDRAGRLYMLLGNHDLYGRAGHRVEKAGLVADEGLILRHRCTGQQIFAVHGHQADIQSDRLHPVSQFVVRNIWKKILLLRACPPNYERALSRVSLIEQRVAAWAAHHHQIVICGHTHRPAVPSSPYAAAYFNTGSCVYPGYITGLEIQEGNIMLVRWSAHPEARAGESFHLKRELLAPPQRLAALAPSNRHSRS